MPRSVSSAPRQLVAPYIVCARKVGLRQLMVILIGLACPALGTAQETGKQETPPAIVSRGDDAASKLINRWFAEGKAAGLDGVWYDNRDRKHSSLGIATYPEMRPIVYTEAELGAKADWGGRRSLLPGKIVVGNSSTAAPATRGGSHQRMYYLHPQGLGFLYQQYRSNALYVYPEHRDHDPGINGPDGYGDLYPANSPYLITSQGSSGSDRVFMHAVLKTIAAFPPATREALVANGLLMPTVQAIFRRSYQACENPADYFTGKAHPSVFEGRFIDEVAMVEDAQGMAADAIPPLVLLKVIEEPAVTPGRDFFEPASVAGERISDSPCAIARVIRGGDLRRTMLVSARDSVDIGARELRFRWVVLRGDPERVTIEPRGENGQEAAITVAYHPRRPIAPGSAMWSNRVDIGVFAEAGGGLVSAPSFVSFTSLPNEHRSYTEDGRLVEIFYGARSQALGMPPADSERWDGLLAGFTTAAAERTVGVRLLSEALDGEQLAKLAKVAEATQSQRAEIAAAGGRLAKITASQQEIVDSTNGVRVAAVAAQREAPCEETKAALDEANARHSAAKKAMRDGDGGAAELKKQIASLRAGVAATLRDESIPEIVGAGMDSMRDAPRFFSENEDSIRSVPQEAARGKISDALQRLESIGVTESDDPPRNERYHLGLRNLDLLSGVLFPDFLQRPDGPLYADPRLTAPKHWRDVHRYAVDGTPEGWVRYQNGEISEFTAGGELIISRKADGSPDWVSTMSYKIDPKSKLLVGSPVG